MKLGSVTKLDTGNTKTSQKVSNDVISENYDVIVFFQIHGQFTVIRKLDFRRMFYKTQIFINNNFLSYKT